MLVGFLFLQAAWILALRPFAGIDEFDHAFKAESVAHGQILPASPQLKVPADVVRAAQDACLDLHAPRSRRCHPTNAPDGALVRTYSTAFAYNPVFYWVVGSAALPFTGTGAFYVMQLVSAVLCAALLGLAAWATTLWARTRWPFVALLTALLPEVIYTSIVVAPDGIETCAGVAFWCSLLGIASEGTPVKIRRQLLWLAVPSGVVLGLVRQLGPLWLVLIVGTVILTSRPDRRRQLVQTHRRTLTTAGAVVAAACFAGISWSMIARNFSTLGRAPTTDTVHPLSTVLFNLPIWLFQSIAAFPYRNQFPSSIALVCGLAAGIALLALTLRRCSRRGRLAIGVVLAVSVLLPSGFTAVTLSHTVEVVWQGRYALPYTLGLLLLCGFALDAQRRSNRLPPWPAPAIAATLCAGQAAAVFAVWHYELSRSRDFVGSVWVTLPGFLLVILVVLGYGALWYALSNVGKGARPLAVPLSGPQGAGQDCDDFESVGEWSESGACHVGPTPAEAGGFASH